MAGTKTKGSIGEAMVIADSVSRGYKVAIPMGEDWRYDLIVERRGKLERVQCKYTESDGSVIHVRCRSSNNWSVISYKETDIDWLAVYDKTTDKCYYMPSSMLGEEGRALINLRLKPTKNKQIKKIIWAHLYSKW